MDKPIPNLDWVKARGACSLAHMFEQLKTDVHEDVKRRNDMRVNGRDHFYEWRVAESPNNIRVVREGGDTFDRRSVGFYLEQGKIVVRDQQQEMFSVTVTLNDQGECKFKIGAEEKESWQIRKKALEEMFYFQS